MSKAEQAAQLAEEIARDDRHGYLWGGWGPDYDCSHLIIAIYEQLGVKVRSAGASYTGDMRRVFLRCGFSDVTRSVNLATGKGTRPGDVLLNEANHAAIVVGDGRIVQARSNFDGKTGDSSGQEIREQAYYNYSPAGWDCVLRYTADAAAPAAQAPQIQADILYQLALPLLAKGDRGEPVRALQMLLIGRDFTCGGYGVDGDFGPATEQSVRNFQTENGLLIDGEVGGETWAALLGIK